MQFFVYLVKSDDTPMSPPSPEGMAEMGKMMMEGMASGLIVATGQLDDETTYVKLEGEDVSVTDGPFIEGKELIPGFTIIKVDTRQEAIDWTASLRRCMGDGELRMTQILMPGME